MPVHIGYSWILALHVFLAGFFMFLLVRYLANNRWAAFVSAIAFMFSGYTVSRIWAGHFEVYTTSVWIPLIFLLFFKSLNKKSLLFAIFTGIALAVQFFAGHNQTSFFTLLILLLYTTFFCFNDFIFLIKSFIKKFRDKSTWQKDGIFYSVKNLSSTLFLFGSTLFFFVIFSAIQLFPTLELTKLSTRASGIQFFMSAYGSFPPDHLIRFMIPDFFGDFLKTLYAGNHFLGEIHWEFTYYIGIIPIFMALYSIRKGLNEKTKRLLAIIMLFIFAISGLTRIIFLHLWKIRNNPVGTSPFIVSIVKFFERIYTGEISMWKMIPVIFILFFGVLLVFIYLRRKFVDNVKNRFENDKMILFFALLSIIGIVLAFGHYSGGLYHLMYKIIPGYDKFKWPARHLIITNFSLCVLAGYCMSKFRMRNFLKFGLVTLILFDLFWYGSRYLYLTDLNEFFPDRKVIKFLQQDRELHRMLTLPAIKPGCLYEPSCWEFQPNASMPLHLYNITGYDPMILKRYHEFTNIIQKLPEDDFGQTSIRIKNLNYEKFLKLLNVKYIFIDNDFKKYQLNMKHFGAVVNSRLGHLLMFKDYLPRFMFVNNSSIAKNAIELKNNLLDNNFEPNKYVLLETDQSPMALDASTNLKNNYKIDIIKYFPNEVELEVVVDKEGYLVSSEVYYPGWKAFIDDKEAKIYRSNYAFRSIFIPSPGKYRIQFKFEPESLKVGKIISFLSLFLIGFYCVLYSNKRIRKKLHLS